MSLDALQYSAFLLVLQQLFVCQHNMHVVRILIVFCVGLPVLTSIALLWMIACIGKFKNT